MDRAVAGNGAAHQPPALTLADRALARIGLTRTSNLDEKVEAKAHALLTLTNIQLQPKSRFSAFDSYLSAGQRVSWVYTACRIIAESISALDWFILDADGNEVTSARDIKELFLNPNENMDWILYIETIVFYLLLSGNNYQLKDRVSGRGRTPQELWLLPPQNIIIIPSRENLVAGYEYRQGGGVGSQQTFEADEIIHTRLPHPRDLWLGLGKIEAARVLYDTEIAAAEWNWKLFEHGAAPSMVVTSTRALDQSARKRFEDEFNEKHSGFRNANRIYLADAGTEIKPFSLSPRDMEFLQQRKLSREEILAMFGVPPAKAGILENANYSNSEEQDLTFRRETVKPLSRRLASSFSAIVRLFDPRLHFEFEDPVKDDLVQGSEIAQRFFAIGAITPNEAREEILKLPRLEQPGMDQTYLPLTAIPVGTEGTVEPATQSPPAARSLEPRAQDILFDNKSAGGVETKAGRSATRILLLSRRIRSSVGRGIASDMRRIFRSQEPEIVRFLRESFDRSEARRGVNGHMTKAPTSGFDWREQDAEVRSAMNRQYQRTLGLTLDVMNQITGANIEDDAPPIQQARARLATRVTRVNDTTRRNLDEEIRLGLDRGYSLDQIVSGVEDDDYKGVRGVFKEATKFRAEMIARTESSAAFDQAAVAAYREVDIQMLDVIGCEDNEIVPGQTYGCNSRGVPASEAPMVEFHPNHTGVFVPAA